VVLHARGGLGFGLDFGGGGLGAAAIALGQLQEPCLYLLVSLEGGLVTVDLWEVQCRLVKVQHLLEAGLGAAFSLRRSVLGAEAVSSALSAAPTPGRSLRSGGCSEASRRRSAEGSVALLRLPLKRMFEAACRGNGLR
jgi:hypothetical protein